jgi:hypothetical protein
MTLNYMGDGPKMSLNYCQPAKFIFSCYSCRFSDMNRSCFSQLHHLASLQLTKRQLQDGGVIELLFICELLRLALLSWTVKVTFLILEWGRQAPTPKGGVS